MHVFFCACKSTPRTGSGVTGNSIFFCAGGTRSASSPNTGKLTLVGEAASWWSASNGTNNNQYKAYMRTIERIADIIDGAVWSALPYNGYFIRNVKVSEIVRGHIESNQ